MTTPTTTFDDAVLRAIEKWPNVPHCFDWLSLDRRGYWLIKGAPITHERATAFIARHYARDAHGRWFVQNGPQRVFCGLAYTPFVYRLTVELGFTTHTGAACEKVSRIRLDELGNILLETEFGIGLIDDRDLVQVSTAIDAQNSIDWFDFETISQAVQQNENLTLSLTDNKIALDTINSKDVASVYQFDANPSARKDEIVR
ncbi:MAG: DUF2946 family protein [Pseudomonadota bacterium]